MNEASFNTDILSLQRLARAVIERALKDLGTTPITGQDYRNQRIVMDWINSDNEEEGSFKFYCGYFNNEEIDSIILAGIKKIGIAKIAKSIKSMSEVRDRIDYRDLINYMKRKNVRDKAK